MQGIGGVLPGVLLGKTAGQRSGRPDLEVPQRHSDTEGQITLRGPYWI
jgi:hypothetical protein